MDIKVKYFDKEMPRLEQNEKGDWIDLRVINSFVCDNTMDSIKSAIKERKIDRWHNGKNFYLEGQVVVMRLGVAIEMPKGKKANVLPRSSTFPTWGLLLANSQGCIDNVYKGDNDEWLAVFYATRSGYIEQYERICQFEITDAMPKLTIQEVESLGNTDRGGHGTSGRK